jgi:hypothetical protein
MGLGVCGLNFNPTTTTDDDWMSAGKQAVDVYWIQDIQ